MVTGQTEAGGKLFLTKQQHLLVVSSLEEDLLIVLFMFNDDCMIKFTRGA